MAPVLLAATYGKPTMELVDLGTGESVPLPSVLDFGGALGNPPVARDGWIAVKVEYRVAAFRDGQPLSPTLLPEAWRMAPAADPALLWVDRYFGGSKVTGEDSVFELVDASGTVHRQVSSPLWLLIGETSEGLVFNNGLWTWDGEVRPFSGVPVAVLAEDTIVVADEGRMVPYRRGQALTGVSAVGGGFLRRPGYDPLGRRAAVPVEGGVLIADADGSLALVPPTDGVDQHAILIGDDAILGSGQENGHSGTVDLRTGAFTPSAVSVSHPRVDVTGRWDLEEIRVRLSPPDWRPPTADERATALDALRAGLGTDVGPVSEAVRLRVGEADRQLPIGGSRLGGPPDLPKNVSWPEHRGRPMAFIGQIRLDELAAAAPPGALPSDGLLSVFVALDECGFTEATDGVSVLVLAADGLARRPWANALPTELHYRPEVVRSEPTVTVPDRVIDTDGGPSHQLLGDAHGYQDTTPPFRRGEAMRLLLQVDNDSVTGFDFGDDGRLHIWAPADLADLGRCLVTQDMA